MDPKMMLYMCLMIFALCAVTAAYEHAHIEQEPSCNELHKHDVYLYNGYYRIQRCTCKLLVMQLVHMHF